MRESPLLDRNLDAPLAWLTRELADYRKASYGTDVSGRRFLAQARFLADQLPDTPYLVNICTNRYLFLLTLCAGLLRGSACLLPQNSTARFRRFLHEHYGDAVVVHDGAVAGNDGVDVSSLPLFAATQSDGQFVPDDNPPPLISDEQLAVVCFTSGSTGDPKAVPKRWKTLRESSAINRRYFCADTGQETVYHYAGVPPNHMWGLETSIFLPLFTQVCVVDAHAEMPGDIERQLRTLPRPVTFISTPLHLKALQTLSETDAADWHSSSLGIERILSATSPLDETLARAIEASFNTEVHEIYGCSEVGSMAHRRPAKSELWTRFEGIEFHTSSDGTTIATAAHLDRDFTLGDHMEKIGDQQFRLIGRSDDLVKIAGKRGSLAEVNKVLLRHRSVADAAVFLPERASGTQRLAAIVSLTSGRNDARSQECSKAELLRYLRDNLDNAFVPRPIYLVDALPRQANGKLPQALLLDLYERLKSRVN